VALAGITPGAAQMNCQMAIADFRDIINTETSMGHVARARQAHAMTELARIDQTCRAGRNAEALRALAAMRSRYGFR
jgi:hypothetical protein